MKKNITIIFVLLTCISIIFIISNSTAVNDRGRGLRVAATIFPLFDITRNIAGDEIEVVQILPVGASPHTYEVTPSTVKNLSGTEVIFQIGLGLDDWVGEIGANLSETEVVAVHNGIDLTNNPHYWLSIKNAKIIARNVCEELKRIDSDNASLYQANLNNYVSKLDETKVRLDKKIERLGKKELITFHDAWGYFADEFGLKIVAEFEPFPGKEPSPKYLTELQQVIEEHHIETIYSEPQLSNETIRPFVGDLGLNLAILDPLGGIEGRESYVKLMEYNVEVIVSGVE